MSLPPSPSFPSSPSFVRLSRAQYSLLVSFVLYRFFLPAITKKFEVRAFKRVRGKSSNEGRMKLIHLLPSPLPSRPLCLSFFASTALAPSHFLPLRRQRDQSPLRSLPLPSDVGRSRGRDPPPRYSRIRLVPRFPRCRDSALQCLLAELVLV